jgi:hypothetical protein
LSELRSNPLVAKSFEVTGIVQNDVSKYHSTLRHILEKNEIPNNVLDDLNEADELQEMFVGDDDSDDSDYDSEMTEIMTESDEEVSMESDVLSSSSSEEVVASTSRAASNPLKRKRTVEVDASTSKSSEIASNPKKRKRTKEADLSTSSSSSEDELAILSTSSIDEDEVVVVPKANKNKRKRAEIDLSDREEVSSDKRVTRGQIKKTKK